VLLIVGLSAVAVTGQTPPGLQGTIIVPPGFKAVYQDQGPAPAVEQQSLPIEKIGDIELNDLVNLLKDKLPGFNGVVIRQPNAAADYPVITQMTLKNVTLGQFLEMIRTEYPGVAITRIDGKGPKDTPLYVFNVSPVPGMEKPADAPTAVQIYRLSEIVSNIDNGEKNPKKAMDSVLSLVQAALDESGDSQKPVLKVHESTQTLIFKGTKSQIAIVQQVLNSLEPKVSDEVAKANAETEHWKDLATEHQNQRDALDMQAQSLERERMELRKQLMDEQLELEQARKELAAAKHSTTQP